MSDARLDFSGTERFITRRKLGEGGMGVVYEVFDQVRGQAVALKTLAHVSVNGLYRLKNEFRALADLTHPNLIRLYDLFVEGRQCYFTMELIDGVDLLAYSRAEVSATAETVSLSDKAETGSDEVVAPPAAGSLLAAIDADRLRRALVQLTEAVCALHEGGKLHRDIKPSNVMVTTAGRLVLLDFGLATDFDEREAYLTMEEHVVGTMPYMSPEQACSLRLTPASDWYGVGATLYTALTGQLPFTGTKVQILLDKQDREPPPPAELAPNTPHDLNDLCVELLRRDPEARPSGRDVLRRLAAAASPNEIVTRFDASGALQPTFVGRLEQLASLRAALGECRRGRTAIVNVSGESGVGKSALVKQFLTDLSRSEPRIVRLTGRCYEHESIPYKAVDGAIDDLVRYLRQLSSEEVAASLPRDVSALARLFPTLNRVDEIARFPRRPDAPDQQELRRRAFGALRELLARLGDRGPAIVLAIDDLQWGDADSAALLVELLRPLEPIPLLFLATFRSEAIAESPFLTAFLDFQREHAGSLDLRTVSVDELAADEATDLASRLLGRDRPDGPALASRIARESRGNAFFVFELVRALTTSSDCAAGASGLDNVSLEQVLARRVGSLGPDERRLLELVSVAGRPLELNVAIASAGLAPAARDSIRQLAALHFLRSSSGGQERIETYHDRIREAVVARLSSNELRECHSRLADALRSAEHPDHESLALHFSGAGDSSRAAEHYLAAGDAAASSLAFDRAAALYRKSLEPTDTSATSVRSVRIKLADALAHAGRGREAAAEYQAAREGAPAGEALELERRAAFQSLISGHLDDGLAALSRVLDSVGMSLPKTPRRAVLGLLARLFQIRIRGLGFRQRDESQVSREELTQIDVCWSVAIGLTMTDTIRGAHFVVRHLLLALQAGEPYRIARGLALFGMQVATAGGATADRTRRVFALAETLANRVSNPHAGAMVAFGRGSANYLYGRWAAAKAEFWKAETMFRDHCRGVAWERDTSNSFALWCDWWQGDIPEMNRRLPLLRQEAIDRGDLYLATILGTGILCIVRLAADQPDAAQREIDESIRRWSTAGFHLQHYSGLTAKVLLELYRGGAGAWRHVEENQSPLNRSGLLRVQMLRVLATYVRGLAALTSTQPTRRGRDPEFRIADAASRSLARERVTWATAMSELLKCATVSRRGDRAGAAKLAASAEAHFDSIGMALYAAAARRRHGEILGVAGEALIAEADLAMSSRGIIRPERMADILAPRIPPVS